MLLLGIFGVDNSSSSHTNKRKIHFLVLGEGPNDINGSVGALEKKFSINFSKIKTKICLSLHYNGGRGYLFVEEKKNLCLKLIIKI